MFELETAITDWKDSFRSAESIAPDSLSELESHLRDTIEELSGSKLTAQETFTVAAMRVGNASDLGKEYSKVDENLVRRKRVLWMVGGYIGGGAIAGVIHGVGSLSAAAASVAGFSGAIAGASSIVVMSVCWLCLFGLLRGVAVSVSGINLLPRGRVPIVASLALLTIVGSSMYWSGNLIQSRVGSIDQMGATMLTSAYGAMAINLAVFFVCLAVILSLYPSKQTSQAIA